MRLIFKESLISIKKNYKRFISIILIVLLGVGFFTGIKVTNPDMEKSLNSYYNNTNFMDFNLISTWGIQNDDINALKGDNYIISPSYEYEAVVKIQTEEVAKIISYDDKSHINKIVLLQGKLPTNQNECLIENTEHTKNIKIGDTIKIEDEILKKKELTVVGIINSPLYISSERGNTSLLSGEISFFMYVPIDNFDIDYYTNLYIKLDLEERDVFSEEYSSLIKREEKKLRKRINSLIDNRFIGEKNEAFNEIKHQKEVLDKEKEKYNIEIINAIKTIENLKQKYYSSLKDLNSEVQKTETEFKNSTNKLEQSKKTLQDNKKILKSKEEELKKNNELFNTFNENYKIVIENYASIEKNIDELLLKEEKLKSLIKEGIQVEQNVLQLKEITENINILEIKKMEIGEEKDKLFNNINILQEEINLASKIIESSKLEITQAEKTLLNNEKWLYDNYNLFKKEVTSSKKELERAYKQIKDKEKEITTQKINAKEKFSDALDKINLAEEEIENLKKPEWYILNHDSNIGFYQYNQDTQRIEKIAQVFPLVFFVVAVLISLNSMTRMVEEERGQLGTLKALGYNNLQIISKYIIYALIAIIIGSILGSLIGMRIIPKIIISMYLLIYNIDQIILSFDIKYALLGTILVIVCILGATLFACYKQLNTRPASLMRPKAPKPGKRVLLERIKFIWNRLSFSRKVTVRNVFRYKKRFLMTIIGISGCTGLIIAGFGLRDCITSMVPMQFAEIFDYQIEVTFKDDITLDNKNKETERITKLDKINGVARIKKESIAIKNRNTNQTVQLIVPFDELNGFINLRNRKTKEKYILKDKGIITEKLANLIDIKIGDELVINSNKDISFKIGDITENYFDHYIYLNKDIYGVKEYNTLLIKTDILTSEEEKLLSKELMKNDLVASITYTNSMTNIFDRTMKNFGLVAVVLIVSAGLLAFVVLYNLSNINISERKRELATIKVLGFYDKEVYNYIGRETTILTFIGMFLGVILGKVLTIYIIKTCELDSIMFTTSIKLSSYIYSLLITLIFTMLVNIMTYFSLKKVDMIESLKSVE